MLYRNSPSRNHRSKGINLKHGIQICLLLAVCFWLIYQIKHSHAKKKEYDESDEKDLHQNTNEELMKLGRKDIHPRVEDGTISTNENSEEQEEEGEETSEEKDIPRVDGNNDEREDEEPTEEVEENKAEDDNVEEKEDEGTGHEDVEMDEHEQEKADTNVDREGELVDEEDREDSAENGTQEMDSEHAHEQISSEETDHDGDDRSLNEAREEHYKADDASSAVTHDIHTSASGNENEHVGVEGGSRKYIQVTGVQLARDNQELNATDETMVDTVNNSEIGSSSNDTVTEMFDNNMATNSSTEVTVENHDAPLQNMTENELKIDNDQGNLTEGASVEESDLQSIALKRDNNYVVNVNDDRSDSNSTGLEEPKNGESHLEEVTDSNNNTEPFASENAIRSEVSDEGNNTDSVLENNDEIKTGKSDTGDGGDETLESTMAENPEDIPHDTIDISDTSTSLEDTNTRVDLDTLPELQTEGTNSEDVAAE